MWHACSMNTSSSDHATVNLRANLWYVDVMSNVNEVINFLILIRYTKRTYSNEPSGRKRLCGRHTRRGMCWCRGGLKTSPEVREESVRGTWNVGMWKNECVIVIHFAFLDIANHKNRTKTKQDEPRAFSRDIKLKMKLCTGHTLPMWRILQFKCGDFPAVHFLLHFPKDQKNLEFSSTHLVQVSWGANQLSYWDTKLSYIKK